MGQTRQGQERNQTGAAELWKIGVPTIETVALGEERKRRFLFENYLITHAVESAAPLDKLVEESLQDPTDPKWSRLRIALALELGRLTARLHEAGFLHRDFHPGNLLVKIDDQGDPILTLIDLDALRIKKRLRGGDIVENLALLDHYFWVRCTKSDRGRFLRSYIEHRTSISRRQAKPLAREVEASTRAWAERLWSRWGKRIRGGNKYFCLHKAKNAWGVAATDCDPETISRLLEDPNAPFHDPSAIVLKDSRTTTVVETLMKIGGVHERVVYKRFNVRKWYEPVFNLFRPSRGWRAWQAGQHLATRGLPTPRNLIFLASHREKPFPPIPRETYVLTKKLEPSETLAGFLTNGFKSLCPDKALAARRRYAIALGRLLRLMHERSISHRDLKGSNILIEGDPLDEIEPRLSLIDLVGVAKQTPLPWKRRYQNLARLNVSVSQVGGLTRTDALRFLREYLPWNVTPRTRWKEVWREIEHMSEEKKEQSIRFGRASG